MKNTRDLIIIGAGALGQEVVWLVEEINEAWKPHIRKYVANNYDCDDFADEYRRFAKNYVLDKCDYKYNLAVFEFSYVTREGIGHVINLYVLDGGFVFVEPQLGVVIRLTAEEMESTSGISE